MVKRVFSIISAIIMVLFISAEPVSVLSAESTAKPRYTYEFYALSEIGSEVYNNVDTAIYIKTDNPDLEELGIEHTGLWAGVIYGSLYDDIDYVDFKNYNAVYKVEGGYLFAVCPPESGMCYFTIYEKNPSTGKKTVGCRFSIYIHDYDDKQNKWVDEVLAAQTNDKMTNFEKMEAVSKYLIGKLDYVTVINSSKTVHYASQPNSPVFKTLRADSSVSPYLLCVFARRIGGFDVIDDLFTNYAKYGYSRALGHLLCYCEADGVGEFYQCCPSVSSGNIEETKIDFKDTSKLYKLKDLTIMPITAFCKGDVTGDGKVNSSDLLAVKRHIKKIDMLTGYSFLAADINGSRVINSSDLMAIKSHIKGVKRLW